MGVAGYGIGYGIGYGYGYGSGHGHGYGSGDGDGYGNGYGYGNGIGYGYGYGSGHGSGHGIGDGYGDGDGYGAPFGYVCGDGHPGLGPGVVSIEAEPVTITKLTLEDRDACLEGVAAFQACFPGGFAVYPRDLERAKDRGLDLEWLTSELGLIVPELG